MSVTSKKEVFAFFDFVLQHPNLFWNANNTGCEAKADLVAELASEKGLSVQKIWIRPLSTSDSFPVYLNNTGTEATNWNYHVAVEVVLTNNPNDSLIIDPTLFENPVDVAVWKERLTRLSNQYNFNLEIKRSSKEAFFGPEDFLTSDNRKKALERRVEILHNSSNLKDPMVFDGFFMKLRGAFVDELQKTDVENFNQLKVFLRNKPFETWFKKPIPNTTLASHLTKETYYGIASSEIKNAINLTEIDACIQLKRKFWLPVGKAIRKLTEHSEKVLNGGFNTQTMTFKIDWEEDYFRKAWYDNNSEEIWNTYGLSVEELQK